MTLEEAKQHIENEMFVVANIYMTKYKGKVAYSTQGKDDLAYELIKLIDKEM